MRLFTFLALLLITGPFLLAQQTIPPFEVNPNDGTIRCATEQSEAMRRQQYPNMETREEFEAWLQDKIAEQQRTPQTGARVVETIPVIVHVIHNGEAVGTGNNISLAQVHSQIDILNEDYRRMAGTAGFNNHPDGADVEIEFCLAYFDTAGNVLPELGINRVDRNSIGAPAPPWRINQINNQIKPQTYWDPERYLNMWVAPITGGILGFAQPPSGSGLPGIGGGGGASTDGVVIAPVYFGRVGQVSSPFHLGRTATHEVGHWLGLIHIWGDGGCGIDDFCMDTPASDDPNYGCPSTHVSCNTVDMVQNYMDYSNDACFNIFTQDQKTRMKAVLANATRRANLLNSTVCAAPTAAPISDFVLEDTFSCDGNIRFLDNSQNLPSTWFWTFGDGGSASTRNPIHKYAASGTYTVTLITNNSFGTHQFSKQVNIIVSAAGTVTAGPDVNACVGTSAQLNATSSDPSTDIRWSPTSGLTNPNTANPTFFGVNSTTYFVTATDTSGCTAQDTITVNVVIPPLVSAGPDVTINPPNTTVQLNVVTNTAVYWKWTPNTGFNSPDTVQNPIVGPMQTTTYMVTGTDTFGCSKSDIIKVTIPGTNGVAIDEAFDYDWGVVNLPHPNPAKDLVYFSADLARSGMMSIAVYDISGKLVGQVYHEVAARGEFKHTWRRTEATPPGVYLVHWLFEGGQYVQKVQLY